MVLSQHCLGQCTDAVRENDNLKKCSAFFGGFFLKVKGVFLTWSCGDHFSFHFSQMITSTEGLLSLWIHHFSNMRSTLEPHDAYYLPQLVLTVGAQTTSDVLILSPPNSSVIEIQGASWPPSFEAGPAYWSLLFQRMLPVGIYAVMVFVLMFYVMREHMINVMYIECSSNQEWNQFHCTWFRALRCPFLLSFTWFPCSQYP